MVLGVNKEDDAVDLGEVVFPQATGYGLDDRLLVVGYGGAEPCGAREARKRPTLLMTTQVERGETDIADCKLLRCCVHGQSLPACQMASRWREDSLWMPRQTYWGAEWAGG